MELMIILAVLFVGYFAWSVFKFTFIDTAKFSREVEQLHKERSALSGDELRKWDENNDREVAREMREVGLDINGNPLNAEIARAQADARGAKGLVEKEVSAAKLRIAIRAANEKVKRKIDDKGRNCPRCKTPADDDAGFCDQCGNPIKKIVS